MSSRLPREWHRILKDSMVVREADHLQGIRYAFHDASRHVDVSRPHRLPSTGAHEGRLTTALSMEHGTES
jgi:hypothetical protein